MVLLTKLWSSRKADYSPAGRSLYRTQQLASHATSAGLWLIGYSCYLPPTPATSAGLADRLQLLPTTYTCYISRPVADRLQLLPTTYTCDISRTVADRLQLLPTTYTCDSSRPVADRLQLLPTTYTCYSSRPHLHLRQQQACS